MNLSERNIFSLFLLLSTFVGIPILFGCIGIYNHLVNETQSFSGLPKYMFLKKSCGKEIIQTNCLQLVLEKDTLKALLSDTEALFYTKNEKELLNIKVKYTNNNIKELIIDNNKIISRKNSLFTGIISLLIGVFFLLFFKWIWSRK